MLTCKHFICNTCVNQLDKPECPVCREPLSGPAIDDNVYMQINKNNNKDKQRADEWIVKILNLISTINMNNREIHIRDINDIDIENFNKKYFYDPNQWYNLSPDQYRDLYNFINTNKYIHDYKEIVKN